MTSVRIIKRDFNEVCNRYIFFPYSEKCAYLVVYGVDANCEDNGFCIGDFEVFFFFGLLHKYLVEVAIRNYKSKSFFGDSVHTEVSKCECFR